MHNSAESLWWPFHWPLTKTASTGAIVMDASICIETIRGYLHFLSAVGPVGFWHATEGTGLCPTALQVQIGEEWEAALLSTSVTNGQKHGVDWWSSELDRSVWDPISYMSEGVSACWRLCMRGNGLLGWKSARKRIIPHRHKCGQTDRWEKCVCIKDWPHESPIHLCHIQCSRIWI